MKKIFLIYIIFSLFNYNFGQVSLSNSSLPNSNVILDLSNNNDKGFRLPLNSSIPNIPGLLYFDNSKNLIAYSNSGSEINYVSLWDYNSTNFNISFNGRLGIGESTPSVKLEIANGGSALQNQNTGFLLVGNKSSQHLVFDDNEILSKTSSSSTGTLQLQNKGGDIDVNGLIKQNGFDLLPIGAVVMFNGTISASGDYPVIGGVENNNWYICNGNNGTPDLRDRFIVGAGSSYSLTNSGGSNTSTHNHSFDPATKTSGSETHKHNDFDQCSSDREVSYGMFFGACNDAVGTTKNHTHSDGNGSHTHDFDEAATTSTGPSATENRPLYYALYYMMKR
tara:strand:+ start:645 stop:1652 length:1008 start_codon:yes stop_codon:yes gene_type:complete